MEPDGNSAVVLSWEEVFFLARKWEFAPRAVTQPLSRGDKQLQISKDTEIAQLETIGSFGRHAPDFYNHAPGWQEAEIAVSQFITEQKETEFRTSQPDPELLKTEVARLEENQKKVEEKVNQRKNAWGRANKDYTEKFSVNRPADPEAMARLADEKLAEEFGPQEELPVGGDTGSTLPGQQREAQTEIASKAEKPRLSQDFINKAQARAEMTGPYENVFARVFNQFKQVITGRPAVAPLEVPMPAAGSGVLPTVSSAPAGFLGNLKSKFGFGKAATGAKAAAGAAAGAAGKKAAVGLGLKALIGGVASGGVGLVLAAAQLLTDFDALKGLLSKLGIYAGAAFTAFLLLPLSIQFGIGGAVLGTMFPILGPITPVVGFAAGYAVGSLLQGASSLFGGGGATAAATSGGAAAGPTFGAAATTSTATGGGIVGGSAMTASVGGFFGSAGGIVMSAIGVPAFGTIIAVTAVGAAMLGTPEQGIDESKEVLFTVTKTVNPAELLNYDGKETTITYTVTVTPGSSDVKIESISDSLVTTKLDPSNLQHTYTYKISGDQYKNTNLINTVTVTGFNSKTNKWDTAAAQATVRIGKPKSDQPYGFPAIGQVYSLDTKYLSADNTTVHCSIFRVFPNFGCIPGGIDIVADGGTDVYSTSDGTIMSASYEDVNSGGAVYVSSPPYVVGYLHLDEESISAINKKSDKRVSRHSFLGKTSSKTYRNSSQPHIHYQIITAGGANIFFNTSASAGKCSEGKYEPVVPVQRQQIGANLVAPPCN